VESCDKVAGACTRTNRRDAWGTTGSAAPVSVPARRIDATLVFNAAPRGALRAAGPAKNRAAYPGGRRATRDVQARGDARYAPGGPPNTSVTRRSL